ncbi:MAG: hypothetical protein AAGC68_17500 [Verrucomicrobiota bacterium]
MKTIRKSLLALAALFGVSGIGVSQEETPIIPVGTLSAFPTIVQTGTHPQLTWEITLPEIVEDIVDIDEPGTVIPSRRLVMDVRILGAGVTSYNSYYGTLTFVPTECKLSYNGSSYSRIFYGTNHDVNPNSIVYTREVEAGDTINLGARYYWNESWGTWFSSTNHDYNVVALRNGDTPPTTTPMHQAPTIESFIRPYLGEDGRLDLGARDVIYLMELTHTDRNNGGWDLQDMAVLLTFYEEVVEEEPDEESSGNRRGRRRR